MVDRLILKEAAFEEHTNILRLTFSSGKVHEYVLRPIKRGELQSYRANRIPSFVLKKDGELLYTVINPRICFLAIDLIDKHICSLSGYECAHLSAAPDEAGGCQKVRQNATGIENFPCIELGYETFSTNNDCLAVIRCNRYEPVAPRAKKSPMEITRARIALAQNFWPDVKSIYDLDRHRSSVLGQGQKKW